MSKPTISSTYLPVQPLMSNNEVNLLGNGGSSSEAEEEPVPLPSRVIHRFYEPIVLLSSLLGASKGKGMASSPPPDPAIDIQDAKQVFYAFVNKLSHVCDSSKGGGTVTSFMVLNGQHAPGGVHYWFATNRQTNEQLENTLAFVNKLLRRLDQAPMGQEGQHTVRRELLSDVLQFNRPRISVYLQALQPQARECLRRCSMEEETDESKDSKEVS